MSIAKPMMTAVTADPSTAGIRVRTWPTPKLQRDEAIIRVAYVGICGTDLGFYSGQRRLPASRETVLGHEIVGNITELGSEATGNFKSGDLVAISMLTGCGCCESCLLDEPLHCSEGRRIGINRDGGFAEFVSVPVRNLVAVPEGLPPTVGTLADPTACVLQGLSRITNGFEGNVLVLGGGAIGLLTAMVLLEERGHKSVTLVDRHRWRQQFARDLGAAIYGDLTELGNVDRYSVIIEASGSVALLNAGINLLEARGTLLLLGLHHQPISVDFAKLIQREVEIVFSLCYGLAAFRQALLCLARRRQVASKLITAIYPATAFQDAFAAALEKTQGKILLSFTELK